MIEAAMLDAGMVILSALGIGLVQAGKPSRSVRVLIMICAAASAGMNLAAADPASWRSVAAYVAAPVSLAVITDRVITVIRQHVLPLDAESAWTPLGHAAVAVLRLAGVVVLYLLRTVLAPSGTLRGLRQMVLDAAPVPGMTDVRWAGGEPLPCLDDQDGDQGTGRRPAGRHRAQSGCKAVIGQRLKLSGMRWTVAGADAIATLRCQQASRPEDRIWLTRHNQTVPA
jgi:hypothetical protein